MKYQDQIEAGQKVSLAAIKEALDANDWDVLYFATEEQITILIDRGDIDEDFGARRDNYAEEMRCMMAEFQ